jgi:pteridine reductase
MDIRGKKALITGGALRLGNALTMKMVETGAEVVVHYNRSETDAYELCDLVNNDGGTAFPLQKDLSTENAAVEIFEELDELGFYPEILINSASIFQPGGILDSSENDFHRNLQINSLVPLTLTREMVKRVSSGSIINLLDSRITDYDHHHVPYHLSKQNLFSITRMLSHELAPAFRVNAIAPGAILPPPDFTPAEADKWYERMRGANPLEINGTVEQISETAEFLIRNDFITGQVLFVDGGRHLRGSFYGL